VIATLQESSRQQKPADRSALITLVKELLRDTLRVEPLGLDHGRLNVFLVLGVNGVGKTTTLAKLAQFYRQEIEDRIVLAAGDTFRAAAIDQLQLWGERLQLPVVRQAPGADPGAVIFDAITSAQARDGGLVLADTAGRMHNKAHLVKELSKIDKVVRGRIGEGNYRKILVIDATTGQNALRQAESFHDAVGVDSIVLAKYDSTAKGGIVVAISKLLDLPFSFLGTGEQLQDLRPFDTSYYLDTLIPDL
jgi:fused signal recognition particle receptor